MMPVHRQWQSSVLTSASFSNDATLPVLKIPACGENMRFIAEDLGHVAALTLPVCLVPVSRTFPTLDAIVFTVDYIITLQMTVASRHDSDAIALGFQRIYEGLPPDFLEERIWFHVFVTDTEDKAKSLRKLKVQLVEEMGIHVYSTFIDIDELNLVITLDRVDKLKEDIVSR
jgi:hypothetical protein